MEEVMLDILIRRRDQLKEEHERGSKLLKEKEAELEQLRKSLERITGAIQVFEEEIAEQQRNRQSEANPDKP